MEIRVEPLPEESRKPVPADPAGLGFGQTFTDRMLTARWDARRGWQDARIGAYAPLALDPAGKVIHYAQEVFELILLQK